MSDDFPADDDVLVLKMLAEGGNNMSQEMMIEFEIIVDSEENADSVADASEKDGFQSHVFFDNGATPNGDEPSDPAWKCVCSKSMIPDHAGIQTTKAAIDRFARKFNGRFESWGTFGNTKKS